MKINNKPEPSLTSSKITRAKHEAAFTCNNNVGDASTVSYTLFLLANGAGLVSQAAGHNLSL